MGFTNRMRAVFAVFAAALIHELKFEHSRRPNNNYHGERRLNQRQRRRDARRVGRPIKR